MTTPEALFEFGFPPQFRQHPNNDRQRLDNPVSTDGSHDDAQTSEKTTDRGLSQYSATAVGKRSPLPENTVPAESAIAAFLKRN